MSEPTEAIRRKYEALQGFFNESTRRRWAATEARALGRGGVALVARATGINPATIRVGLGELETPPAPLTAPAPIKIRDEGQRKGGQSAPLRVRAPGGGRKPMTASDPTLLSDLDAIIEPTNDERPTAPLRWTGKSTRELARELAGLGHRVSQQKVAEFLRELGYSLRSPHGTQGGKDQPDGLLQFHHLSSAIRSFHAAGQPVVEVVSRMDLPAERLASPHSGNRVLGSNVIVAAPAEHADFPPDGVDFEQQLPLLLGQSLRVWWWTMGRDAHPGAARLLITATWGSSMRARLQWKLELQALADDTGLTIQVCHLPLGTRKWSGIEHVLTNCMTHRWHDQPPTAIEVGVSLLASPAACSGCDEAGSCQPTPARRSRTHLPAHRSLRLTPDGAFGEWNYFISPSLPEVTGKLFIDRPSRSHR